jgi:hypothetical protein
MTLTPQEREAWAGRELYDPFDVHIGRIVSVHEGSMAVELADGETRDVPVARAARSGRAIRTPYTAEQVLAGRVARSPLPPRPHAIQSPVPPAAGTRDELVGALRDAHGQLRTSLERLAVLRGRVEDEELVHDLAFHHADVQAHAAAVRRRLGELDATRAPLRDSLVQLVSWLHVKRRHVTQQAATADARETVDVARDELRTWTVLGDLARRLHDPTTAALADRGRADVEALLYTVAASWRRFAELDHQRHGTSAFAPPPDLSEFAPRS